MLGKGAKTISGLYIGAGSSCASFLGRLTLESQLPLWSEEGETASFCRSSSPYHGRAVFLSAVCK